MSVITVSNLTKDYGKNRGIFDLSFEIQKGEVFGYLGPNGAGKTTTIRHLLGFLNADKGECHIGQLNCRTDAEQIQRDLGYLPGEIAFFDDMSGIGYLKFIANMRGMKNFEKMNELISYFELDPSGRIKKMSKGMKQKIGIVSAFMHDPSTLILDEPTSGLDPLMQNKFIELILNEKSKGKTILMSSHSFEEVERTCDRIGIIKKGRFVTIETVENLKKAQRKIYSISLRNEKAAKDFATEPLEIISINGDKVQVAIKDNIKVLTTALDRHPVTGIDVVSQSLEEVFMSYYGGENNA
ncbi:ABC transporter ATP-binding protein [uncultured Tissierella sp.]|jgi:ABC-2 type transport system ATP-binding protein|uniref:ABC transporter ATP-binding protein n=1 Tax=uncultured Tissierella sp. TaxID=448160 RepID=UPI002803B418|nr:ABC transporter ATP-binding protein [uncultured Tissierella sp.]MDU5083055.1 ABC transporter ATP-binding protein [Bacillota bacterium]